MKQLLERLQLTEVSEGAKSKSANMLGKLMVQKGKDIQNNAGEYKWSQVLLAAGTVAAEAVKVMYKIDPVTGVSKGLAKQIEKAFEGQKKYANEDVELSEARGAAAFVKKIVDKARKQYQDTVNPLYAGESSDPFADNPAAWALLMKAEKLFNEANNALYDIPAAMKRRS